MILLTDAQLDPAALQAAVAAPGNGGLAFFAGAVRDRHEGKAVVAVTYEAFRPLAEKILAEIAAEAEAATGAKLAIAHRTGRLQVGELSVFVAAGAPHRAEAFEACRRAIDTLKDRVPVWKKEHYADGTSGWLEGCTLG